MDKDDKEYFDNDMENIEMAGDGPPRGPGDGGPPGPPPRRRHGRCHAWKYVLFAIVFWISGLVTSCLQARCCPNKFACCCKRAQLGSTHSQIVVPAVVVNVAAGDQGEPIITKPQPAMPTAPVSE